MRTNEKSQTRITLHSHLLQQPGLRPLHVGSEGCLMVQFLQLFHISKTLHEDCRYKIYMREYPEKFHESIQSNTEWNDLEIHYMSMQGTIVMVL